MLGNVSNKYFSSVIKYLVLIVSTARCYSLCVNAVSVYSYSEVFMLHCRQDSKSLCNYLRLHSAVCYFTIKGSMNSHSLRSLLSVLNSVSLVTFNQGEPGDKSLKTRGYFCFSNSLNTNCLMSSPAFNSIHYFLLFLLLTFLNGAGQKVVGIFQTIIWTFPQLQEAAIKQIMIRVKFHVSCLGRGGANCTPGGTQDFFGIFKTISISFFTLSCLLDLVWWVNLLRNCMFEHFSTRTV